MTKITKFTYLNDAVENEFLRRIATGETANHICKDEHMPSAATFYGRKRQCPDFAAKLKEARDIGFDALAEGCLDIADDRSNDSYVNTQGQVVQDKENVQRSKLRVWTRLQLLQKWDPVRYGELVKMSVAGTVNVEGGGVSALLNAATENLLHKGRTINHDSSDGDNS